MAWEDLKPVLSCSIVCLGGFSHGCMLSWPAEILPQLTSPNSKLGHIDASLLSWIASVNFLGCMVGSLFSSILYKIASEKVLITSSALFAGLSWLMVGLSTSPIMLCSSRILLGVGNALLMSVIPPYISSIAPPKLSGLLSSMYGLSLGLGLVYSVTAGRYMEWTDMSLLASIPAFVLAFCAPFLVYPEKDDIGAQLSRGLQPACRQLEPVRVGNPGLLLIFLASMFIFSGVCPLSIFGEFLFMDERTFTVSDLVLASNICQVVGGLVGAVAIDKYGRKPVLRAGGWICLLSNILLSLYFSTVKGNNLCPTSPGSVLCWSPFISTCLFFLGFGGGLGGVFWVLLGELVPLKRAGSLIPMVTFYLNLAQFSVIRSFIYVEYVVGLTDIFFIQAGLNFFFLIGQASWLPETRPDRPDSPAPEGHHYGTFMRSQIQVDRYTTASPANSEISDYVLNDTEFVTRVVATNKIKEFTSVELKSDKSRRSSARSSL